MEGLRLNPLPGLSVLSLAGLALLAVYVASFLSYLWGAGLDAWYNDQFAYRARIVQFYRFLLGDVLASPIVDNEVPGTGGWMYRNGESWPEIKDYLGVFELTPAETARWIEFFEGRCEWAAAHGARYLQAITPVKAQIHPEHLPPAVARHRGQCVREQVRAALEGSSAKDSVLFLTDAVREITDRGNNVEIRRKGDGYSVLEVSKKSVIL